MDELKSYTQVFAERGGKEEEPGELKKERRARLENRQTLLRRHPCLESDLTVLDLLCNVRMAPDLSFLKERRVKLEL